MDFCKLGYVSHPSFGLLALLFTIYKDIVEDENEDVSRAIELSLQESNGKRADVDPFYIDEDEELARALQESLKISGEHRTCPSRKRNVIRFNREVCDVCEEPTYEWVKLPFWGQILCQKHVSDQTPRCCSCHRYKPRNLRYVNLGEVRKLCPDCHSTAIMDSRTCEPLLEKVHEFFKQLSMKVDDDIPFYLVDKKEMAKITRSDIHPEAEVLGLTTSYHKETIMSIKNSSLEGGNIEVVKKTNHFSSRQHEILVLILFGLPRVLTGSVMAHEMMHAWMMIRGAVLGATWIEFLQR